MKRAVVDDPKLRRKDDAADARASLSALAEHLLRAEGVAEPHIREVLRFVVTRFAEARFPRLRLPLRSEAAHEAIMKGASPSELRQDFVFRRSWLVDQIMASPQRASQLLARYARACVVTRDEAMRLDQLRLECDEAKRRRPTGWKRYEAIGLSVVVARRPLPDQPSRRAPPLPIRARKAAVGQS